jgi:signal transduction histidine kinase
MAAHPESHNLRKEAPGEVKTRSGRPRLALAVAFSGLLALMIFAGVGALRVLRQLHTEEQNIRQAFLARQRTLTIIRSSVVTYSDRFERYLLDDETVTPGQASKELSSLMAQIESAVGSYPRQCPAQEQALLRALTESLADHQSITAQVLSWDRAQRHAQAARFLNEEVRPRQFRLSQTEEKISVYVGQRLGAASQDLQARYDSLNSQMTRLLLASLGAALLLSLGSAIYILGLEREAQRRYQELAQNRLQLQQLSERLVDAQEAERRSISRELHDEVGQSLGAVLVDLGRVSAKMAPGDAPVKEQLDRIKGVVENTVQSVRNIALLLRPSMLDDLGLVAALEWLAREVSRRSQMEVDVQSEDISEDLPDDYRTCIYRLVQEALNNAARHASARVAHVTARQTAEKIVIVVKDDGRGFDPQKTRGMGILGMHERVTRLGGALSIKSQPGRGTVLKAELPVNSGG